MRRIGVLASVVCLCSVFGVSTLAWEGEAQAKTPLQRKHEAKGAAAKAASKAKSDARRNR